MDLIKDFVFKNIILRGKVPKEILKEAKNMVKFCRRYKDSPLSELRYLDNIGRNNELKKLNIFLYLRSNLSL